MRSLFSRLIGRVTNNKEMLGIAFVGLAIFRWIGLKGCEVLTPQMWRLLHLACFH